MTIAPLVVGRSRPAHRGAAGGAPRRKPRRLAARQRLQRLEQLLKDGAASVRSVEEARAQHQVVVAALTAARERLPGDVDESCRAAGRARRLGAVRRHRPAISAVPGQTVAASAPLLEIAQVDTLWVRVAVFAGDADGDRRARSRRRSRGSARADAPARATRVTAPLQGDPASRVGRSLLRAVRSRERRSGPASACSSSYR